MQSGSSIHARERIAASLYLLPLLFFIIVFVLAPVLGTLASSFLRDLIFAPQAFAGLDNYASLARDEGFWNAVRFTVLFTVVSVPLELTLGLAIAVALNEPLPMRGLVRAAALIPWAIPAAVSGRVFELVYNYSHGAANWALRNLGLTAEPINWLGSDLGAFLAVVIADGWKTTPFVAIILLAGLSALPDELYEQAKVDRAGVASRFLHITLPLLKPVLLVALLFRTIEAIRVFDVIYVLTGGGPGGATESLSIFAYRYFSSGDFGYGAAASVVLFLLALVLSVLYVRAARRGM